MAELQDITGVGPSRAESLTEAGYPTVRDIAEADEDALVEATDIREDQALEFIVRAQDLLDAEDDSSPEDYQTVSEEIQEASEPEEEDDAPVESEPAESASGPADEPEPEPEPDDIEFHVAFDEPLAYDTFFECLLNQRATMQQANRTQTDAYEHAIEQMRAGSDETGVDLSLSPKQLNDLHNTIRTKELEYKGQNLIDEMNAIKSLRLYITDVRKEHLF